MKTTLRIYVASSWRNDIQPDVVSRLREAGFLVYDFRNPKPGDNGFRWRDVGLLSKQPSVEEYKRALEHPRAIEGFHSDFDAMQWADALVLVLPCGRSAHLEAGWACGAGKHVVVMTRDGEEPELMALMANHICGSVEEVIANLRGLEGGQSHG